MSRRFVRRSLAALALLAATLTAAATAAPVAGTFALTGGAPKVRASLIARPSGDPLLTQLDIWETAPGSARAIRSYAIDMTKKLHLIAVSDDFATFLHVHPALGADGHFRIGLRVPHPGLYHLYADAVPQPYGQQVFRFDVALGAGTGPVTRRLEATAKTVTVGPYTVNLDSLFLDAGHLTMLTAHVRERGAPVRDLRPYLGALAHAVLLNARDLSYVHVHPMEPSAMEGMHMSGGMGPMAEAPLPPGARVSPDMMLHVTVRRPGTYKLWLQFQGRLQLYVAPFVLNAR